MSAGRFDDELKSKGYDQAMHLGVHVLLSDGTKWLLEKNERIKATPNPKTSAETQDAPVAVHGKGIRIADLINNTVAAVGEKRFYSYHPATTNCQQWCLDVLQSNGLLTPQLQSFIHQDVGAAVKTLPWFTEHLLDAVAVVGRGQVGSGIRLLGGGHQFRRRLF